jgi:uncharacterized protein YkwD
VPSFRYGGPLLAVAAILCLCGAAALAGIAGARTRVHRRSHARSASAQPCRWESLRPGAANLRHVERGTLCLINRLRSEYGLSRVRPNFPLTRVARRQARLMVAEDYFADVGPSGQTPISLVAGTRYSINASGGLSVGQNIAWATPERDTPAQIVAAWFASPPHRAIMLAPEFTDAGVGVIPNLPNVAHAGVRGGLYVVELGARHR